MTPHSEGGLSTPVPSDFDSFPYHRGEGYDHIFFFKMNVKDWITIIGILSSVN